MIITLTPDDIIKRCLWSDYKRFALRGKSESELQEIVQKNEPIAVSEELAYVIGLLKVIETSDLKYRFNNHMIDILKIKSTIIEKDVYISVKVIENELKSFVNRFPKYWEPESTYETTLLELKTHTQEITIILENVIIHTFRIKDRDLRYYLSKDIKKIIDKK